MGRCDDGLVGAHFGPLNPTAQSALQGLLSLCCLSQWLALPLECGTGVGMYYASRGRAIGVEMPDYLDV